MLPLSRHCAAAASQESRRRGLWQGAKAEAERSGFYDTVALTEKLVELKDEYTTERRVIFMRNPDIEYEALVDAMDATRDDGDEGRSAQTPVRRSGDEPRQRLDREAVIMSDAHGTNGPAGPVGELPRSGALEQQPRHKKHKNRATGPKADITINSLLDVFSVLLVFLMKSYSTSTVTIKPSTDLPVPFSMAQDPVEESTAVTVTLNHIMLDDKPVLTLSDGKVAEQDLSHSGMLVNPLLSALQEEVQFQRQLEQRNPTAPFKGVVTIIADRYVPTNGITQMMYTAGQAEYSKFKFLLVKVDRG